MALCLLYLAVIGTLDLISSPIDVVFFAQREAVQLRKLLKSPMTFDKPVALSEHGQLAPSIALLRGWSIIENWGVWTDGDQAQLAVALPADRVTAPVLELWAEIVRPPNGKQTIRLEAGGQTVGRWDIDTPEAVLCVQLTNNEAKASGLLRVTILVADPVRPAGGLDRRRLGLGLVRLAVLGDRKMCAKNARV